MRAVVTGRVQGVGFRHYVRTQARFLGVTGYVRNEDDGSVEVVAEGLRPVLHQLLGALREGSSYSEVEGVAPTFGPATGEFAGFDARL